MINYPPRSSGPSLEHPMRIGIRLNSGRYQIQDRLGRGGMGTVYLAVDKHNHGQLVAIKENTSTVARVQQQFRREAEVLARLNQANLPSITDYFVECGERQYLVMDYIDGENLRDILARRSAPLAEQDIIPWVEQIMDALTYMHTWSNQHTGKVNPIIHRDIKPGNIKRASNGKIYLVDFGIAKVDIGPPLGTSSSDMPHDGYSGLYGETPLPTSYRTVTGARAFSAGYSPIEQYTGGTDVRTDIYALGATLYSLLTNRVPPEAPNIAVGETFHPPRHFNPKITRQTERVILKAMSMQPKRRYKSIEAMRLALQRRRWYSIGVPTHWLGSATTRDSKFVARPASLTEDPRRAQQSAITQVSRAEPLHRDPMFAPDHPLDSSAQNLANSSEYSHVSVAAENYASVHVTPVPAANNLTSASRTDRAWWRTSKGMVWATIIGALLIPIALLINAQFNQLPLAEHTDSSDVRDSGAITILGSPDANPHTVTPILSNSALTDDNNEASNVIGFVITPTTTDKISDSMSVEDESLQIVQKETRQPTSTPIELPSSTLISSSQTSGQVSNSISPYSTAPPRNDVEQKDNNGNGATREDERTLAQLLPNGTPTRAPTPTTTTVATSTPTSTTSSTATRSATRTPSPTRVPARATSALPTPIPTQAISVSSNVLPTPTARPATPYSLPTATATQLTLSGVSLALIEPKETVLRGQYIFRWHTDLTLTGNQAFEIILWEEGSDPMVAGLGPVGAGQYTEIRVDLDQAIDRIPQLNSGRQYRWGILLVETDPYRRLSFMGQSHSFQLERSRTSSPTKTPAPRG